MDIEEYPAAAERGLALLDQYVPNWENMVDTNTLDMSSLNNCVMGQVFPAEWFSDSVSEFLGLLDREADNVYQWAEYHGFDPGRGAHKEANGFWFRAIIARRGGRK